MMQPLAAPGLSTSWYLGSQRRRLILLGAATILLSLLVGRLIFVLELGAPTLLYIVLAAAAITWRPIIGLYLAFALILLFEPGGPDDLMLPGRYLHWGLQSTLRLSGLIASPLELLLLLTLGSWLARGVMRRDLDFRAGRLMAPLLLFYGAILFGLLRGWLDDGDMYIAFWEARALLYLLPCYLLGANLLRSRPQLRTLTGIVLIFGGLFALEGAYRHVALIQTGELGAIPEFAYAHETVVFLGLLPLLVIGQSVIGAPLWQRLLGSALVPIAIFTLLATQRRAGYIAAVVAFLALALVFLFNHRKAFLLLVVPILIGGAIYLPLFWNYTGMIGQPARAVRSLSEPDPRDERSNDYRRLEKINVIATIQSNPLFGVGFGRKFIFAVPLPSLAWWPFWHYEPHHNLHWVWLKTGAIGFALFWVLMGLALTRAAHLTRRLRHWETRSLALLSLVAIIISLVFCYVDLGLVNGRVTVFLGTLLGVLAVLDRIDQSPAAA